MESVIASAIAVLGTLLGSVATLAIQRGTAERGHRFTRDEKLRQERLDAYVTYAGALVDYRRCLIHLWFCLHESPPPENPDEVRIRSYDLRTRAQESLFRVQMLTADEALGRVAPASWTRSPNCTRRRAGRSWTWGGSGHGRG